MKRGDGIFFFVFTPKRSRRLGFQRSPQSPCGDRIRGFCRTFTGLGRRLTGFREKLYRRFASHTLKALQTPPCDTNPTPTLHIFRRVPFSVGVVKTVDSEGRNRRGNRGEQVDQIRNSGRSSVDSHRGQARLILPNSVSRRKRTESGTQRRLVCISLCLKISPELPAIGGFIHRFRRGNRGKRRINVKNRRKQAPPFYNTHL